MPHPALPYTCSGLYDSIAGYHREDPPAVHELTTGTFTRCLPYCFRLRNACYVGALPARAGLW
ncbi:hypothetical protein [Saccharopolyspora thermophila]|uniref:hypothetical protein n=1 Tax=Saccharopolyspora thermophila TaxID=89367 RepID=UPI0031F9414B